MFNVNLAIHNESAVCASPQTNTTIRVTDVGRPTSQANLAVSELSNRNSPVVNGVSDSNTSRCNNIRNSSTVAVWGVKNVSAQSETYVDTSQYNGLSLPSFMFLWPCIVSKAWGKKTNKMQQYRWFIVNYGCWVLTMSQHVSGIFMPIIRSKDHVLLLMKCICWQCWMWQVAVLWCYTEGVITTHVVFTPDDGHKDARNMLRHCQ